MTAPLSTSDIDLRFIERDGKRILQVRRPDLSKHQHYVVDDERGMGIPAYLQAGASFVWGGWQDVRIEPLKGDFLA